MALQTSGAISLNDIHAEAGGSSGTTASINDSDIRALISKGSGATMSFNEWYGAAAGWSVSLSAANTTNSGANYKTSDTKLTLMKLYFRGDNSTEYGDLRKGLTPRMRSHHSSTYQSGSITGDTSSTQFIAQLTGLSDNTTRFEFFYCKGGDNDTSIDGLSSPATEQLNINNGGVEQVKVYRNGSLAHTFSIGAHRVDRNTLIQQFQLGASTTPNTGNYFNSSTTYSTWDSSSITFDISGTERTSNS